MASLTCIASSRVGHEDERERHDLGAGVDQLQHGQGERRGLAGAGRRLAEQVAAGEQVGDGLPLDRRRLFVAEVDDGLQQFGAEAEGVETLVFVDGSRVNLRGGH